MRGGSFGINLKQARSCGGRWGQGGIRPGAMFMEFLYPAPLSSLEFIGHIRDTLIQLRVFSGETVTGSPLEGSSMMSFALDFVFVTIGAAAFAVTALYLNACARL
jgi:hypothetical protein